MGEVSAMDDGKFSPGYSVIVWRVSDLVVSERKFKNVSQIRYSTVEFLFNFSHFNLIILKFCYLPVCKHCEVLMFKLYIYDVKVADNNTFSY